MRSGLQLLSGNQGVLVRALRACLFSQHQLPGRVARGPCPRPSNGDEESQNGPVIGHNFRASAPTIGQKMVVLQDTGPKRRAGLASHWPSRFVIGILDSWPRCGLGEEGPTWSVRGWLARQDSTNRDIDAGKRRIHDIAGFQLAVRPGSSLLPLNVQVICSTRNAVQNVCQAHQSSSVKLSSQDPITN